MAQHDFVINNQGFPSFRSDLNDFLNAVRTTHSGTSTPTGAVAGTIWLDTTTATTPTLKYYDGTDNISLATIDHVGNTVNWLDSTVSITGLTTTATGTVLTLSDSASTSTVNLIIDNQKEIQFRETTANGTNYVALKAPASVSADLTFTLPATDGTNGQVLTTNGSGVLSFTSPSTGISWQSTIKTSGFTAVAGEGYFCDTTSSAFTVTLPASPTAGQQIGLIDYAGTASTNNITIDPNGNKIQGSTGNFGLLLNRKGTQIIYVDATQGWLPISGVNDGTILLSAFLSVDSLIIAGGGGGGSAGGGGAGGYRTITETLTTGTNYQVTVGAGASGGFAPPNGSNSVFASNTSAGGGAGAYDADPGIAGGSGGGGGYSAPFPQAGGAGNTPSTSPSQGNAGGAGGTGSPAFSAGGGGGAGAVGQAGQAQIGGAGGNGTASSITGSSVTRAGGGGGGHVSGTGGNASGGNGGGGTGGKNGAGDTAGTANTGGGGGGNGSGAQGGQAGGSGIVIVKYPDTYTILNSGGGLTFTTSSSGGFKVTSFTAGTGTIQFS